MQGICCESIELNPESVKVNIKCICALDKKPD